MLNRSGAAVVSLAELGFRFFGFDDIGLVPFALAKSLNADEIDAFPPQFLDEADAFVLGVFDSFTHLKFRIAHILYSIRRSRG